MDFVSKIGDVLTMDNDANYLVLDCINFNDNNYLFITNMGLNTADIDVEFAQEKIVNNSLKISFVEEPGVIENLIKIRESFKD